MAGDFRYLCGPEKLGLNRFAREPRRGVGDDEGHLAMQKKNLREDVREALLSSDLGDESDDVDKLLDRVEARRAEGKEAKDSQDEDE